MLATTYAAETQKTNLRVNLIDPGRIRTGMRAAAYPGEDPKTLPPPEHVTDLMVELASPDCTKHGERITVPGMAK
jgi:NAD(P)-dependent dehydrogenase (short-subunit alcohol dehydrogenase family)